MSSPPSDQHGYASSHPSSSSWSLVDFNSSLSCLLQEEELQQSSAFMSSPSPSPSPSLNPSQLLSSHSSMGPSTTKVSKRKSRAANKPPIRVLSADRASFRDMVQKLTGIPTSPSLQSGRLWGPGNNTPSSLFRPMTAGRPGYQSDFTSAAHQNMPTLDTSSAYLTREFSHNNLMYNEVGNSRFNSNYDTSGGSAMGSSSFKGAGYAEGGNADMENMHMLRRTSSELESLLMVGNNKLEDLLLTSRIDPWLSSDIIHTPTPHVEIAHSA